MWIETSVATKITRLTARFHLWITRDVDWNVEKITEHESEEEFHLWITRDVDWNFFYTPWCKIYFHFISGLPEMWIETQLLSAKNQANGFHLWITRDVDWNLEMLQTEGVVGHFISGLPEMWIETHS